MIGSSPKRWIIGHVPLRLLPFLIDRYSLSLVTMSCTRPSSTSSFMEACILAQSLLPRLIQLRLFMEPGNVPLLSTILPSIGWMTLTDFSSSDTPLHKQRRITRWINTDDENKEEDNDSGDGNDTKLDVVDPRLYRDLYIDVNDCGTLGSVEHSLLKLSASVAVTTSLTISTPTTMTMANPLLMSNISTPLMLSTSLIVRLNGYVAAKCRQCRQPIYPVKCSHSLTHSYSNVAVTKAASTASNFQSLNAMESAHVHDTTVTNLCINCRVGTFEQCSQCAKYFCRHTTIIPSILGGTSVVSATKSSLTTCASANLITCACNLHYKVPYSRVCRSCSTQCERCQQFWCERGPSFSTCPYCYERICFNCTERCRDDTCTCNGLYCVLDDCVRQHQIIRKAAVKLAKQNATMRSTI
jgi:hypothetical protein